MNYNIYTGYVENVDPNKYGGLSAPDFWEIWIANTGKYNKSEHRIHPFGPDQPPVNYYSNVRVSWSSISSYPNLGHVEDYVYGKRTGKWCGWTTGIIIGMMDAYANGVDFLYKEQDCLAFGNYIERMYNDLGDADIVYGSCRLMGPAQSLFLVKRNAIPDIIASLAQDDDSKVLPEYKFARLPVKQKRLSFGYDRDRPFDTNDSAFYVQQLSVKDLEILKNAKLV